MIDGGRRQTCDLRTQFVAHATLGRRFALERDLPPEVDHPVGFPEADYLKVLVFRERERA